MPLTANATVLLFNVACRHCVERFELQIGWLQGRYLHSEAQRDTRSSHADKPRLRFEPTIAVLSKRYMTALFLKDNAICNLYFSLIIIRMIKWRRIWWAVLRRTHWAHQKRIPNCTKKNLKKISQLRDVDVMGGQYENNQTWNSVSCYRWV